MVESFFGIPGVSLPTVSALSSLVIAWPLNWLLDRIRYSENQNSPSKMHKNIWDFW